MLACPVTRGQKAKYNVDLAEVRQKIFEDLIVNEVNLYLNKMFRDLRGYMQHRANSPATLKKIEFRFTNWQSEGVCKSGHNLLNVKDYQQTKSTFKGYFKITVECNGIMLVVDIPKYRGHVFGAQGVKWEGKRPNITQFYPHIAQAAKEI